MTLARVTTTALAAIALCFAQEITFRAGTRLVEVSVTVLDRDGNPVTGLEAGDFTIEEAGKPRPVAVFQFDGEAAPPKQNTPPPPGVFTNMVEASGGAPRNISALVLDGLNTQPEHNARVRAEVMRYLKALAPDTRVAVFHMGRQLRVLHDFTDDAESLGERVARANLEIPLETVTNFEQSVIEAEQFLDMFGDDEKMLEMVRTGLELEMEANAASRRSRMERTLAAMEALSLHLAGIPGRKNLIWITGGISMVAILGEGGFGPHGDVMNFEPQVRNTSRLLAQRGIALYIVDAAGLQAQSVRPASSGGVMPIRGRGRFERQMEAETISNDPFAALSLMASVTGGRHLYNTNDLATGFRQAAADLRGSYTLGFYAPEDGDGKWHRLRVRVARPGVKVRHREGYFAENGAAPLPEWNDDSWRAAILSPLGSSAVRFRVTCQRGVGGTLQFHIRVSAASLQFRESEGGTAASLAVMLAGRSPEGRLWTALRDVKADLPPEAASKLPVAVVPITLTWKPDPAVETVRVIVRDKAAGQYGAVDVPLKKLPPAVQ